jgi:hypothetical protein
MKKNCWEVKACGRCTTMQGDDACPVCREAKVNGIHGGKNGGRVCWTIAHTRCGGVTQGTFSDKFTSCKECDFYKMVKEEEKGSFMLSASILPHLR